MKQSILNKQMPLKTGKIIIMDQITITNISPITQIKTIFFTLLVWSPRAEAYHQVEGPNEQFSPPSDGFWLTSSASDGSWLFFPDSDDILLDTGAISVGSSYSASYQLQTLLSNCFVFLLLMADAAASSGPSVNVVLIKCRIRMITNQFVKLVLNT